MSKYINNLKKYFGLLLDRLVVFIFRATGPEQEKWPSGKKWHKCKKNNDPLNKDQKSKIVIYSIHSFNSDSDIFQEYSQTFKPRARFKIWATTFTQSVPY